MNTLYIPVSITLIITLSASAVLSEDAAASKKAVKAKGEFEEENYGVKYASKCEVCKIVTSEVEHQLNSKFNSPEVLEIGYNYLQDSNKHKKKAVYEKSLIRLQEALESTCGAMLEYNIHKERKDWTRFARGQSQTFKTLHGLRNKGVKVDLGMPNEMWDKPSAEITQLKSQCDTFIEEHEEAIENWYQEGNQKPLEKTLCKSVLPKKEQGCLKAFSDKLSVDSKVKKPSAESPAKKPLASSSVESSKESSKESSEESSVETPLEDLPMKKPLEDTPVEKSLEDSTVEKPLEDSTVEKPIKSEL
ncbi:unnamed protein product [Orchesella dallaii]|uniref:DUF3456 domain-containing protein n=1 Tax=Orchesella dallaii TaxID=48710 RepID=A0ABP1S039_9HEXA